MIIYQLTGAIFEYFSCKYILLIILYLRLRLLLSQWNIFYIVVLLSFTSIKDLRTSSNVGYVDICLTSKTKYTLEIHACNIIQHRKPYVLFFNFMSQRWLSSVVMFVFTHHMAAFCTHVSFSHLNLHALILEKWRDAEPPADGVDLPLSLSSSRVGW